MKFFFSFLLLTLAAVSAQAQYVQNLYATPAARLLLREPSVADMRDYLQIDGAGTLTNLSRTALTGGAAGSLDAIITTNLTANQQWAVVNASDVTYFYYLDTGTDAESSPAVIRPDDYNGASNAKVWKLANVQTGKITVSVGETTGVDISRSTASSVQLRVGNSAGAAQFGADASGNVYVRAETATKGVIIEPQSAVTEIRNGATAQVFRVYNTYTDASNYERAGIRWAANTLEIFSENAGTGTARNMHLMSAGRLFFGQAGVARWEVGSSGHFLALTDNTYDIGASGATRPRNVYVGTSITMGVSATVGSAGYLFHSGRSAIASPASGVHTLTDSGGTTYDRLQFGGTTASFPAIKRSTTTLETRLADDSGYAAVQTLYQRFGSGDPEGVVAAPVGATYSRTDGGTGTAFYVKETGTTTSSGWVAK